MAIQFHEFGSFAKFVKLNCPRNLLALQYVMPNGKSYHKSVSNLLHVTDLQSNENNQQENNKPLQLIFYLKSVTSLKITLRWNF